MGAWTDFFNNLIGNLFGNNSSSSQNNNITRNRGGNKSCNLTFRDTVNYDLAMDLYYNKRDGYKLGAFFCHNIIFIPMAFMGFPHFEIPDIEKIQDSEFWADRLKYYNDKYYMLKQMIQKICHIAGTILIYPWFDSGKGYVAWKFIKPKYVNDIFIDPETQKITGIITKIEYTYYDDSGIYRYYKEKTYYTKKWIKINRSGNIPPNLRVQVIRKNPTGILPVVFTNDVEAQEFEGHSEFERILPLIKAYSEINLHAHEETVNIRPKLVQGVDDSNSWLENNGFAKSGTIDDDISIKDTDFILNKMGKEETSILVPENLTENDIKIMNLDFWGIVEGSGIPEICWGLKTEGNHASAKEQMTVFLSYVSLKQKQLENPYIDLINATLSLDAVAYNKAIPENVINVWNELDVLTEIERAEVFDKWCAGISKLSENHGIDLESIHKMLLVLTKDSITSDFKLFKKQIEDYGSLKSMLNQEYGGMRDFDGQDSEPEPEPQGNKIQRNGHKKPEEIVKK